MNQQTEAWRLLDELRRVTGNFDLQLHSIICADKTRVQYLVEVTEETGLTKIKTLGNTASAVYGALDDLLDAHRTMERINRKEPSWAKQ